MHSSVLALQYLDACERSWRLTHAAREPRGGGGNRHRRSRSRNAQPRSRCTGGGRPAGRLRTHMHDWVKTHTASGCPRLPWLGSSASAAATRPSSEPLRRLPAGTWTVFRGGGGSSHERQLLPIVLDPSMKLTGLSSALADCPGLQSPAHESPRRNTELVETWHACKSL